MTAQFHENLILNGRKTSMAFCPPLPEGHPRLYKRGPDDDPGLDPFPFPVFTTACWRGYVGTWEIKADRLYLVAVDGIFQLRKGEPIFADWFSGTLRIPQGKQLLYVHMGFGSVFERELHIRIEKGIVVATRVIDNRGMEHDAMDLGRRNLPGGENRFRGDDEL